MPDTIAPPAARRPRAGLPLARRLLAASVTLAACSDDAEVLRPEPPSAAPILERYVALGNSITAGFQSDGIDSETQEASYAKLLADAAGASYRYVPIPTACRPPIINFQTQQRKAPPAGSACVLASPPAAFLNNVAVPGATVADGAAPYSGSYNPFASFILGGKSQAGRALDADPTFVSVWLGNNDVLVAALSGVLASTPNVSPGVTPANAFINSYASTVNALVGGGVERGLLIGVVNVLAVPALFPAESLLTNPAFKAQFDAAAGGTVTVLENCRASGALVSIAGLATFRTTPAARVISCVKGVPAAGAGEAFVLDATEQTTIAGAVAAYNAYIEAKADSVGFAYLDPNLLLGPLKASGAVPARPDFASAAPFGPYISLDGVHPSTLAHRVVANAVAQAINEAYDSSIPAIAPTP